MFLSLICLHEISKEFLCGNKQELQRGSSARQLEVCVVKLVVHLFIGKGLLQGGKALQNGAAL